MVMKAIDIAALSYQSGLPPYLLDYFERIGLLESPQSEDDAMGFALDRAKQIAEMRKLGFSTEQIKSLLEEGGIELIETGAAPCGA